MKPDANGRARRASDSTGPEPEAAASASSRQAAYNAAPRRGARRRNELRGRGGLGRSSARIGERLLQSEVDEDLVVTMS